MKAETIAIELKKWSFKLPSTIQIDKILKTSQTQISYEIDSSVRPAMSDNYPILLIHIMQLYGVMLLGNQFSCIYCLKRPNHRQFYR